MGERSLGTTEPDLLLPYVPRLLLTWPEGLAHQLRPGSLVSADISGFTALSERLAEKGREGAEELTAVINHCFTGMIDDCDRHAFALRNFMRGSDVGAGIHR